MPKKPNVPHIELKKLASDKKPNEWKVFKGKASKDKVCEFLKKEPNPVLCGACGKDHTEKVLCPGVEPEVEQAAAPFVQNQPKGQEKPQKKFSVANLLKTGPPNVPAPLQAQSQPKPPPKQFTLGKQPTELYDPKPIGVLPRYIDSTPDQTVYYAPKAIALMDNIGKLNAEDFPFTFAHLIIGDTPSVSAVEATAALVASGVPLVQIRKDGANYVMFWKDGNQERQVAKAEQGTTVSKKGKEIQSKSWKFTLVADTGGYGVLLISRDWPFVEKSTAIADMMKSFSLFVMNHEKNKAGTLIRYLTLDTEYKEGTDVFNVKYIHLFSPFANASERVQAVGRGVRRCGQRYLDFIPGQGWTVQVFVYATDLKLSPDQTTVAELAIGSQEDANTSIGRLINQTLYDNAISQVLWTCEPMKFKLIPAQRKASEYLDNLVNWINAQIERGISESELKIIFEDMTTIYNDIGSAADINWETWQLYSAELEKFLELHRQLWDTNQANKFYRLDQKIAALEQAQTPDQRRPIITDIQKIWPRVPAREQHRVYSLLAERIEELVPTQRKPQIIFKTAKAQKLAPLPVPTAQNVFDVVKPQSYPEENYFLVQLRNFYEPGYQFPAWILLTPEDKKVAELYVPTGTDVQNAFNHAYYRVPSMDPNGNLHYDEAQFRTVFDWGANFDQAPVYAIYTLAQAAETIDCGISQPNFVGQAHLLHTFVTRDEDLYTVLKMIYEIAQRKNLLPVFLPILGREITESGQDKMIDLLIKSFPNYLENTILYGNVDLANTKNIAAVGKLFSKIYFGNPQYSNALWVNDWNPVTMIGNGNCGQPSLDADIGRHTNSIALGWWGSNSALQTNIIELELDL